MPDKEKPPFQRGDIVSMNPKTYQNVWKSSGLYLVDQYEVMGITYVPSSTPEPWAVTLKVDSSKHCRGESRVDVNTGYVEAVASKASKIISFKYLCGQTKKELEKPTAEPAAENKEQPAKKKRPRKKTNETQS